MAWEQSKFHTQVILASCWPQVPGVLIITKETQGERPWGKVTISARNISRPEAKTAVVISMEGRRLSRFVRFAKVKDWDETWGSVRVRDPSRKRATVRA